MKVKKSLAFLISFVMLLAMFPASVFAAESVAPEVVSQQLNLSDNLTLHFYVKADSATDVTATVNEKTDSYDLGSMEPDANGQYVISVALAAAQMTEEITLDFVKNGASVLQKIYSIRGYADAILEGNYSAKTKELVRHMLNYGAAAQQYFGVNTEKLANAGYEITEEVTLPAEYEAIAVSGSIAGMQFYGASLVFDNKIAVRYYFTGSVDGVSYGDYEVIEKNGMHYVEVPGINPQDYAKSITLTAAKGEEKLSVSYSPLNYIIRMSEKGSTELKALLNALYGYHAAAVEYVNNAGFFGSAYGYETDSQMDLIADTGANTGTVSVANDGISFGYIQDFREENFYFEAKFHANNVLETENWPKFGLFVQGENVQDAFYVDMNREQNASVVGRTESIDGTFDWENTKTAWVDNMAFSAEGEKVTLGILKDGKRLHMFVNGNYVLSTVCGFDGSALAGIFSFNTGLTVTEYFTDLTNETMAAKKALIPAGELTKGEVFGYVVGDEVLYGTSNEIDLTNDQGDNASISIYGGAPQYAYLNDVYTDKFCFETEINVAEVLNGDAYPKFGIMVNGSSEMVKFFVDMSAEMTASRVGVVYQPTGGGDDWANSRSYEVPGMVFTGSDTIKLKLTRDGSAYYFYVNDALVAFDELGFKAERGAVGIFSFNAKLTAKEYSVQVGANAEGVQAVRQLGLTHNWFTDNGDGSFTLSTDSDAQHMIDDLTRGGIVVRKAYYRAGGKVTLTDASEWGQARIIVSDNAQNEHFIALEKLPAGNYQIFAMSKAAEDNWNEWKFIGNTGKNTMDFEVVVIGSQLYFLLDGMICYETDRVAMTESTVKFTGFNVGTTTVADLSLEIFADIEAANAYISGKAYKPEGLQEATLSTNYFAESTEGSYSLTTNSDAQHLVDDVLSNGLIMREARYSLQGKLSLTDANEWGQARIIISSDAQNEYFIALEKLPAGHYQIITMSKAAEENWNEWVLIGNTGRNVLNFEIVVNGNKVYFLLNDLICYETDRVSMAESTVKFTGFNVGNTAVENLVLKTFADSDAVAAYVADKAYKSANKPETLLSTNYFTENSEGVYTLTTDSDAVHLVDDVLADGTVMRKNFYSVKGKLSLTNANEWGQARILISSDAQNEYFIALEKLPTENYQIFSMSKTAQENWDVWELIADENKNGTRNAIDFELVVVGNAVYFLIDGAIVYTTNRVAMTESTVKFTGYNVGTTTVENLSAQIFDSADAADAYLAELVSTNQKKAVFYKNELKTEGADPSAIYISEGDQAGYYYMYVTSDSLGVKGFLAYRSQDMVQWECVGTALSTFEQYDEATGYTTVSYLSADYWAPEVIYDGNTGLYYLFYSATLRVDGVTRFYADIAVSDSPAGPFVSYNQYLGKDPVVIDEENKILAYAPVFDFANMDPEDPLYETKTGGYMKVIDMSPFVDPVSGKKYVYFCHDLATELGITKSSIYVMALNDDYTPDYSKVYALTEAESALGEGKVNEAPYVVYNAQSGKYYLLYSANAFYQKGYCVRVAVADRPVGPFRKLTQAEGGSLLYTDSAWTWAAGTGHCSIVSRDGQDYIVYHAHKEQTEEALIRGIAMDELHWVENADGLLVPVANGPSVTAMPLTADQHENIASSATITADYIAEGSVEDLRDGVVLYHDTAFLKSVVFDGSAATINLQFDEVKSINGIAIYNGSEDLFSGVASIRLQLAGGGVITYENLACAMAEGVVLPGSGVAVAFSSLNVVSIEIVMPASDAQYAISEIAVMAMK